jgi:hypothetical protein
MGGDKLWFELQYEVLYREFNLCCKGVWAYQCHGGDYKSVKH